MRKPSPTWVALALLAVLVGPRARAQSPCTDAQAPQTPGKWERSPDDTAMADGAFPRARYPALFAKADRALQLVQKAMPSFAGTTAHEYRSVRGGALVKDGPVPFGLNTRWFDLVCAKAGHWPAAQAGRVVPEEETGTVFEVYFNSLGWLMNDRLKLNLRASNGASFYYPPKAGGDFHGATLYLPKLDWRDDAQAVVFTFDGRSPYKPVSRERYLESREKALDDRVAKLKQGRPYPGREQNVADLEAEKGALAAALAGYTPEERQQQAVVKEEEAPPGKRPLFVTEAQQGRPVVTVDGKLFHPTGSREAIRVITVYWNREGKQTPKRAAVDQLAARFDWEALKQMLER